MSIRPESMQGRGTGERPKIVTVAHVGAAHGDDPSRVASRVSFSFAPTERRVVDEAVAAFRKVIDEAQA